MPLLGESDVRCMYEEHRSGLDVARMLRALAPGARVDEKLRRKLLRQAEEVERHVAERGEPLEVMGRIPCEEREALYERLLAWRRKASSWPRYANSRARCEDSGTPR